MKLISEIIEDMMEEVHDAKHRIERAGELKPLYPDIARRESEIAEQELVHAEKDHKSVVEIIEEYKKAKGDPPEYVAIDIPHPETVRMVVQVPAGPHDFPLRR